MAAKWHRDNKIEEVEELDDYSRRKQRRSQRLKNKRLDKKHIDPEETDEDYTNDRS